MKKIIIVLTLSLLISCTKNPEGVFTAKLIELTGMESEIRQVFPFEKLFYPIGIVHKSKLYFFAFNDSNKTYELNSITDTDIRASNGLRAAFPLKEADFQCTCIVSPDAFSSKREMVLVFHEFVHCAQFASCENKIKDSLRIAREAMEKQDYMWELNYPFPYEDGVFTHLYSQMLENLAKDDLTSASETHKKLEEHLSEKDYEYLCWQEWKEGYARYVENTILTELFRDKNTFGTNRPFSRVTFYAGGSELIRKIIDKNPLLKNDPEKLFYMINSSLKN